MTGEKTIARTERSVLFLAYYFPPLGGGGVQRSINFTRYLPDFGYRPVVVTRPDANTVQWGPRDSTLSDRIPAHVSVSRVRGPEPARSDGWRCRAERWLRIEERFSRWWVEAAVEAGRGVLDRVDVIYASMSPFESAEAAARLAQESGKPWVADLRDPWALDDWLVFPTGVHRRLELRTMRRALASADAIVMNTPESSEQLRRHAPELRATPIFTIPNGYAAADFATPPPKRDASLFRIVHAGNVHTRAESRATLAGRRLLRGAAQGFESSARSHLYVQRALEQLLERRPELRGRVRLELVGPISDADRTALPDLVHAHGYLSHAETLDLLRCADLLFLPMHELAPRVRARIVPGKTYEYVASGTPILAAVPDGDARDLLERVGNSFIVRPTDVAGMARVMEDQIDSAQRREPLPARRIEVVEGFERRRLTSELAGVFDSVLGGSAAADAAQTAISAGIA